MNHRLRRLLIPAKDWKRARSLWLPWWGVLCVILFSVLFSYLFSRFGRFDLARPALLCIGALFVAVIIKWDLRRQPWYWVTIAVIAALHVPVVVSFRWTAEWVPAIVTLPIFIADLAIILALLSAVERFVGRTSAR